MTPPPDSLIVKKGLNMPGKWRKCEDDLCPTYVRFPYCYCSKHIYANYPKGEIKEWIE